MEKAFTLAEILITLAIIGIVAALTIPSAIFNVNKSQYYTGFMKSYNTLAKVMNLAFVKYGDPNTWSIPDDSWAAANYIGQFLNVAETCGQDLAPCNDLPEAYATKTISGEDFEEYSNIMGNNRTVYKMPDGSYIYVNIRPGEDFEFVVDLNGPKEPNTIGRDLFYFQYLLENPGRSIKGFMPLNMYDIEADDWRSSENVIADCDPQSPEATGYTCGIRLLKEGKMNY